MQESSGFWVQKNVKKGVELKRHQKCKTQADIEWKPEKQKICRI